MLDMNTLLPEFAAHVAAMSDEDVRASILNAEQLTAGCANEVGDISEYDISECYETEFQSIPNRGEAQVEYSFISSNSVSFYHPVMERINEEVLAA